jgi:circadian clock protein KaiB
MSSPDEARVRRPGGERSADETYYELTLFVSGASNLSARAIAGAQQLCETHLNGCYHLSVVDVHTDPAAVLRDRVVAAPTLVKNRPLPMRKVVGDMSQTSEVLQALELLITKDTSGMRR